MTKLNTKRKLLWTTYSLVLILHNFFLLPCIAYNPEFNSVVSKPNRISVFNIDPQLEGAYFQIDLSRVIIFTLTLTIVYLILDIVFIKSEK